MNLNKYAKSIAGALTAGAAAFAVAVGDASAGGTGVVGDEWVVIVFAILGGLGLVWLVPNTVGPTALTAPVVETPTATPRVFSAYTVADDEGDPTTIDLQDRDNDHLPIGDPVDDPTLSDPEEGK